MSSRPSLLLSLCSAALLVLLALPAPARLGLQTFESLASGPPPGAPWLAAGGALAVTDVDSATGEHSMLVPATTNGTPAEAAISTLLNGESPGFVDLWLKPVSRTLGLHPAGHAFHGQPVESTGVLYIDGANFLFHRQANRYVVMALTRVNGSPWWLRLGGFAGAPADYEIEDTGGRAKDWLRLTVRRDLAAGTFDVWLNDRLVGVDLSLQRLAGHPEFRLLHRASSATFDGPLAPMLLDDLQATGSHPIYADSDGDALPDVWESAYQGQSVTIPSPALDALTPDRYTDLDFDLVPKISEYFFGSRPTLADSDGDGLADGFEIEHGLNPASRLDAALDKDGDGFSNLAESLGQGNGNPSLPPAGALTNVVYVKADHAGVQNGQYATPYRTLSAAMASPYLTSGGRIVIRGEGGVLTHYASDWQSAAGNSSLIISRPVTLVGVNLARIQLQQAASFATINITAPAAAPVFSCESVSFENCRGDDGGVFRIVGTPGEVVLRNCRFSFCSAADDGGALYAHAARLTIEDCWFENCASSGEGGAVHLEGGSQALIRRTYFQSNTAGTDGGAVSLRGATVSPIVCESSVFQANAAARGGSLAAVDGADASLLQCTISANTAGQAAAGAALFGVSTASVFSLSGCILWDNAAGGVAHAHLSGGAQTVTYSTLSGWTAATGSAGIGNNGSDPGFRVQTLVPSASAMLDSSNPVHNATTDFLNNPRWDAPGGTNGTVADRGAFERQKDSDGDGLSDDWEARYALNASDASDADADADQDGYSNREEFTDKTDPRSLYSVRAPVVFVSSSAGKDWHPGPNAPAGTAATASQGTRLFPFQTIRRAILGCPPNRRIVLLDGKYSGAGNTNLKFFENWSWKPYLATTALTSGLTLDGKTIRGLNGASRVTLDGGDNSRLFDLSLPASPIQGMVTLQNLSLRRGAADVGGAIRVTGAPGLGVLSVQGCIMSANRATTAGGAIHVTGCNLSLTKSSLYGNDAPRGGAVALADLSPFGASSVGTASINQCRFSYNLATAVNGGFGQGGGLSVQASSFSVSQTRFEFNHAERQGGAVVILSSCGYYPASFGAGTAFEGNTAGQQGGALHAENACLTTTGTAFIGNIAGTTATTGEGGAVSLAHPTTTTTTLLGYSSRTPQFVATRFLRNAAGVRGGGIAITDSSPLLTNCAFIENQADPLRGRGGAVAVTWQSSLPATPEVPVHASTPRFIHATFACNRASLATNVHSDVLTTPWLINTILSDGVFFPLSPSLVGPRQIHGCQLAAPDAWLTAAESDSTRRNSFELPALAFDWFHLGSPVRAPGDTTSIAGGVEPSAIASFSRPAADIDGEARPAAAAGAYSLIRGCDEPRDADMDGLPDWFELLAVQYSQLDAVSSTSQTHPVTPTVTTLPAAYPTNNVDADAYTFSQELKYGGRPDAPESDRSGRDTDGDGLSDIFEIVSAGLNWLNPDQDSDGFPDGWEHLNQFSPTQADNPDADTDHDGLSDLWEQRCATNPREADTDRDGMSDGAEDQDKDGQPNQFDAHPLEALINWPRTTEPRFAVVPLGPVPFGLSNLKVHDMNNKGEVVAFADPPAPDPTRPGYRVPLVWRAGAWQVLGPVVEAGKLQLDKTLQWFPVVDGPTTVLFDSRMFSSDMTVISTTYRPIQISEEGTVAAHATIQNNGEDGKTYVNGVDPQDYDSVRSMIWPSANGAPSLTPVPLGHSPLWPYPLKGVGVSKFFEHLYLAVLRRDGSVIADGAGPDVSSCSATLTYPYDNLGVQNHQDGVLSLTTHSMSRSGMACGWFTYGQHRPGIWNSQALTSLKNLVAQPCSIASMPDPANITANGPQAIIDNTGWLSISSNLQQPICLVPNDWPAALDRSTSINERGECLLVPNSALVSTPPHLWRNGRLISLATLVPSTEWTITTARDLNDYGAILASARRSPQGVAEPVMLIPIQLTAHNRGTFNAPGAQIPAGTGEYGYETTLMENGDSESAADSTARDCDHPDNLSTFRKATDDDLVKLVLKFPPSLRVPGASLKVLHAAMQVDATQTSRERAVSASGPSRLIFWRADGTRITNPESELQIADLAAPSPTAYLSNLLKTGELTLFLEGGDRFGNLPEDRMTRLGGAVVSLELTVGKAKTTESLLVYRGGFLRFLQPHNQPGVAGTFEFRDGKGRIRHRWGGYRNEFELDETDLGSVLATWSAKSGKTNANIDYRRRGTSGHVPPGWWWNRENALATTERQGHADSGKIINANKANETWYQAGFCRWRQDDLQAGYSRRWEFHLNNAIDASIGRPSIIEYKFRLSTIQPTSTYARSGILIHPDGKRDGTLGCIGIQSFEQCKQVAATLRNYHGLKTKIETIQP